MNHRLIIATAALGFGLLPMSASATLIGDTISLVTTADDAFETPVVTGGTGDATVDAGVEYSICVGHPVNSDCPDLGLLIDVDVEDSAIRLTLSGASALALGTIVWEFTDLDWVGMAGEIVGVTPQTANDVHVDSFGPHSLTLSTARTNFVGGFVSVFEIEARHVVAPGVGALLALGVAGIGIGARRRT